MTGNGNKRRPQQQTARKIEKGGVAGRGFIKERLAKPCERFGLILVTE
jgi:hypothetical protein